MVVHGFISARIVGRIFPTWAAVVKKDGELVWACAKPIGRTPRSTLQEAWFVGCLRVLEELRKYRREFPEASVTLYVTSRKLLKELQDGERWVVPHPLLSGARRVAKKMGDGFHIESTDNQVANEMITLLAQRYRVPESGRFR